MGDTLALDVWMIFLHYLHKLKAAEAAAAEAEKMEQPFLIGSSMNLQAK